jgi:hypothetical protein
MHKWLEDFSYWADISWCVFAIAGTGKTVISLLSLVSNSSKRPSLIRQVVKEQVPPPGSITAAILVKISQKRLNKSREGLKRVGHSVFFSFSLD